MEAIILNPLHIGNHAPVFMPDSKRVAYFGNFDYADALEICVFDPDKARPHQYGLIGTQLTSGADGVWHRSRVVAVQPEWEQIFFVQGHMQSHEAISVVRMADLPSNSPIVFTKFTTIGGRYSRIGSIDVAPDGSGLVFDADQSIFAIQTDGSNLKKLSPNSMNCQSPRFSPDGKRIAFLSGGGLYVCELDGSDCRRLSAQSLTIESFVWL
jgi:hypothetical protein